jgi:ElaB/YqjD/DUF883 family membrane-anchored ribosome-binding protein
MPLGQRPYYMEESVMKELVKAVRHETLGAIDNGEKLIRALGNEPGKGTETLRKSTKHLVRRLKEELTRWESEYHKARGSS